MNAYHAKVVEHIYPFLEREFQEMGGALCDYLFDDEIILELVNTVRRRTTPGTSRFTQMVCLYKFDPLARAIAWYRPTPGWPVEYILFKDREAFEREQAEARRAWEDEMAEEYATTQRNKALGYE